MLVGARSIQQHPAPRLQDGHLLSRPELQHHVIYRGKGFSGFLVVLHSNKELDLVPEPSSKGGCCCAHP